MHRQQRSPHLPALLFVLASLASSVLGHGNSAWEKYGAEMWGLDADTLAELPDHHPWVSYRRRACVHTRMASPMFSAFSCLNPTSINTHQDWTVTCL